MNFARILKLMLVVGILSIPFAGCDSGGSTPDKGATGPATPPPTAADIAKINEGAKGMGPGGVSPKK